MKRIAICLLTVMMILCLSGCGGDKDIDLNALAGDLTASAAFSVDMSQFAAAPGIAQGLYRYEEGDVTENVLYYSGSTGEEILLAKCADKDAAGRLAGLCQTRVTNQKAVLESYVPEAIPRLDSAVIRQEGSYLIFVVANDAPAVQSIVDGYLK